MKQVTKEKLIHFSLDNNMISAVMVTELKPKTAVFSEPWRTETEVFLSHVSSFQQFWAARVQNAAYKQWVANGNRNRHSATYDHTT